MYPLRTTIQLLNHSVVKIVSFIIPSCRDSRDPTLYRVGDYDKNKQWLKGKPKPITDEPVTSTTTGKSISPAGGSSTGPGDKRIATISGRSSMLEASQVHDMIQGAVSGVVGNFVGITRAVRQRILPDKQLLEVGQCAPKKCHWTKLCLYVMPLIYIIFSLNFSRVHHCRFYQVPSLGSYTCT